MRKIMKTYRKRYINQLKNFRKYYLLLIIFSIIIFALCIHISIFQCFSPFEYKNTMSANNTYEMGTRYVDCSADTLNYTGYDYTKGSTVKGYYYYSLNNETCTIYLLSKKTVGSQPALIISDVSFTGKLVKNDSNLNNLLKYMSHDLKWNYNGIQKFSSDIIISECDYNIMLYVIISILAIIIVIADAEFIIFIFINKKHFLRKK